MWTHVLREQSHTTLMVAASLAPRRVFVERERERESDSASRKDALLVNVIESRVKIMAGHAMLAQQQDTHTHRTRDAVSAAGVQDH